MKKIAVLSAFLALFVLTGCPDKDVDVEGDEEYGEDGGYVDEDGQGGQVGDEQAADSTQPTKTAPIVTQGRAVGSVYFDFDKFNIRPDMQSVIDSASQELSGGDYQIVIEGNTDEFGTDEYNYALGTKRAISTRDALVVKGVKRANIRVVSFGESKPVCTNKTKQCYQQNRRADIKIAE